MSKTILKQKAATVLKKAKTAHPVKTRITLPAQTSGGTLEDVAKCDQALMAKLHKKVKLEASMSRQIVSFQANKTRSNYRWYKYKEGFSAALVEDFLHRYNVTTGRVLDPFAGSGTTMFVASKLGIEADGIELLPIGQQIIEIRKIIEQKFSGEDFNRLKIWCQKKPWLKSDKREELKTLRITKGAYSPDTLASLEKYLATLNSESRNVQKVLKFALLCILESISFTRKDGQYLRWDHRSERRQGARPFNKGIILSFEEAIVGKLREIIEDVEHGKESADLLEKKRAGGKINLLSGSCLEILPKMAENTYDAIITSPPYCNRYDYTRTYALELALLGTNEDELTDLRQQMLSCTVENRAKDLLAINPQWALPIRVSDRQELLQNVLHYLDRQREQGLLNNPGIPRMVRGYFYEMACVIFECGRVLKPNAPLVMVNDNVRYAGASISVDLILSDMAQKMGFELERIMVLPRGKGNSSQQMGEHGREAMRKCVYIWRKR